MGFNTKFFNTFKIDWSTNFGKLVRKIQGYKPAFWLNNLGQSNKTATNTRTSAATAFDYEGVLVTGEPGEIMLDGGRREHNLLPAGVSRDLSGWATNLNRGDVTTNAATSSDGLSLADLLSKNAEDLAYRYKTSIDIAAVNMLVVDVKIQDAGEPNWVTVGISTTTWFDLASKTIGANQNINATIEDLGEGWLRLSITSEISTNLPLLRLVNGNSSTQATAWTTGKGVYFDRMMVAGVVGRSSPVPMEFLDSDIDYGYGVNGVKWYSTENGNTVAGNIVIEGVGADITPVPQVLIQPQRTNGIVNSFFSELGSGGADVFTGWAESASGSSSISQETEDLPAGFVTGCRFDIDGANSIAYLSSASTLTVGVGGLAVFSGLFKCSSGTGLRFSVRSDDNAGGTVHYLSSDGLSWGTTSTDLRPTMLPAEWGRMEFPLPPLAGANTQVWVATVVRTGAANSTERFTALQLEPGTKATAPIKTTTAAATRDNDSMEIVGSDTFINSNSGIALMQMIAGDEAGPTGQSKFLYGELSSRYIYRNPSALTLQSYDGTNVARSGNMPAAGTPVLVGLSWDVDKSIFSLGYLNMDTGLWSWGANNTAFVGFSSPEKLLVTATIELSQELGGIQIFDGQPVTATDYITSREWIEDNAEAKINQRQA